MYRQIIKQPSVRGIAAGAVATVEIPTNGTHYATYLRCISAANPPVGLTRAQLIADISNIVVRLNGTIVVDATVTFLLDLQLYYGACKVANFVNGIVPIWWEKDWLPNEAEQKVFAIGTNNVDSFTVDVTILGVAVLSQIEVYSEVTPEKRNIGQHIRINKFPNSFATTGVQEISTLPKEGADCGYVALHIEANLGTFQYVTVKLGGYNIFENVSPGLNQVLLNKKGRTPQAGYYHVDFARSNDLSGFLPMAGVQDFRQQITWITAAPTTFNVFREAIFGLSVKA